MKLGTLYDIWNVYQDGTPGCDDCDVHNDFANTRSEAIKWILSRGESKEMHIPIIAESLRFSEDNLHLTDTTKIIVDDNLVTFIKHFFNITNEELNDVVHAVRETGGKDGKRS